MGSLFFFALVACVCSQVAPVVVEDDPFLVNAPQGRARSGNVVARGQPPIPIPGPSSPRVGRNWLVFVFVFGFLLVFCFWHGFRKRFCCLIIANDEPS